jgi:hypothetical protein
MKKPEMMGVRFEPAKGGAISHTETRTRRGGQGGGPDYDHEDDKMVHPTIEHAQAHLADCLGGCFTGGKAEEPESE